MTNHIELSAGSPRPSAVCHERAFDLGIALSTPLSCARTKHMNKLSEKGLVDQLIEAYVSWREARVWVSDAYRSRASAKGPAATVRFSACKTALDRQERAAELYARLVRRTGQVARSKRIPAKPLGWAA